MNVPEYLTTIPTEIPAGRVLVHNHVRPTRRLGSRGFRAWLAEPSERLEVCGCGWAAELGEHYLSPQPGRPWEFREQNVSNRNRPVA